MIAQITENLILPASEVSRTSATGESASTIGIHDDSSINPMERDETESCARTTKKIMKCKKPIIISSFNARTIRVESRAEELALNTSDQHIAILGVQEQNHT